jgi:hypothetical protein
VINQKTKLIFALMQIDNLTKLLKDNEYESFLYSHLISIDVELKRQLTNIKYHSKIKE